MKRPAFQFYPADWRKDTELQSCSIGARGLWHELMCIMHECEPYGHLAVNGSPMAEVKAARLCGVEVREFRRLLAELQSVGVPSKTSDGIIYSRRMVRDEHIRNVRAKSGSLGGNPALLADKDNQTATNEPEHKDNQIPTPSVSASSSSSSGVGVTPTDSARKTGTAKPVGDKSPKINGEEPHEAPTQWWKTNAGIEAKGRELGIKALPGEQHGEFKARLFEVIGQRERQLDTAKRTKAH